MNITALLNEKNKPPGQAETAGPTLLAAPVPRSISEPQDVQKLPSGDGPGMQTPSQTPGVKDPSGMFSSGISGDMKPPAETQPKQPVRVSKEEVHDLTDEQYRSWVINRKNSADEDQNPYTDIERLQQK